MILIETFAFSSFYLFNSYQNVIVYEFSISFYLFCAYDHETMIFVLSFPYFDFSPPIFSLLNALPS
jgi:hypothetical protein